MLLDIGMQMGAALARFLGKEVATRAGPLHEFDKGRPRHLKRRERKGEIGRERRKKGVSNDSPSGVKALKDVFLNRTAESQETRNDTTST